METKRRQKWTTEVLNAAVRAVSSKEMGYLKASKQFGIPKRTIERYVKIKNHVGSAPITKLRLGRRAALSENIEKELVEYCIELDKRYYGLRLRDIRFMAFQLAIKNNLKHPFSQTKKIAGKKWLRSFLRRHPILSIRTPQSVSTARVKGFTRENVQSFFNVYEPELRKINNSPSRLYNVDETGLTVVQSRHSKILSVKGKKQVYALTSLKRGKLITAVTCMSASGHYIPPLLIFPRKNRSPELMDGTPPGSIDGYHPSGWIQTDLFTKWLRHFINHTKPTADDPVLLVLDGHYTHTRNIDVIEIARDNHVTIVCLPPHCTHKMQPMDVGFMHPLKTYYAQAVETWLRNHPGRAVTNRQVGMLFGEAYKKAATVETSINAFKKTGLFPCNRNIFTEVDFAVHDNDDTSYLADMPESDLNTSNISSTQTADIIENIPRTSDKAPSPTPGCSRDIFAESSDSSAIVSPFQIRPPPCFPTKKIAKSSRAGSANVITSTSYKQQLEEALRKKEEKVGRKKDKEAKKTSKKRSKSKKNKSVKRKVLVESAITKKDNASSNDVINSSSEDEIEDAECPYCSGLFSQDTRGERWVKCVACFKWAHEQCGEEKSKHFLCALCNEI